MAKPAKKPTPTLMNEDPHTAEGIGRWMPDDLITVIMEAAEANVRRLRGSAALNLLIRGTHPLGREGQEKIEATFVQLLAQNNGDGSTRDPRFTADLGAQVCIMLAEVQRRIGKIDLVEATHTRALGFIDQVKDADRQIELTGSADHELIWGPIKSSWRLDLAADMHRRSAKAQQELADDVEESDKASAKELRHQAKIDLHRAAQFDLDWAIMEARTGELDSYLSDLKSAAFDVVASAADRKNSERDVVLVYVDILRGEQLVASFTDSSVDHDHHMGKIEENLGDNATWRKEFEPALSLIKARQMTTTNYDDGKRAALQRVLPTVETTPDWCFEAMVATAELQAQLGAADDGLALLQRMAADERMGGVALQLGIRLEKEYPELSPES